MPGRAVVCRPCGQPRVERRWATLFRGYRDAMVRRNRFIGFLDAAQQCLAVATPLTLLWLGVYSVLDGQMTLGTALAANAVAVSVLARNHCSAAATVSTGLPACRAISSGASAASTASRSRAAMDAG
jgi:hypothetical protein